MNKHQLEAVCTLIAEVARYSSTVKTYDIPRNFIKLQKLASSLHKRYEAACSYEWTDTEAYRARTEALENKALRLAEDLGIGLEIQGDPRGWPFIVRVGGAETRLG